MVSGNIYDAEGVTAFNNLLQALENQKDLLDDSTFVTLLAKKVHYSPANVQLKWHE